MKTKIILLMSLCCLLSLSCKKDDTVMEETTLEQSSIIGNWNMIEFKDGGVVQEYGKGAIRWTFDETNLTIVDTIQPLNTMFNYSILQAADRYLLTLDSMDAGEVVFFENGFFLYEDISVTDGDYAKFEK